jgi:hypothetical protein
MLDVSEMGIALPDNFLTNVRNSFFVHDNMMHLSIYIDSAILKTVALMVAKLTNRKEKLTLHDSEQEAMAHLQQMVEKERV